MHGSKQRQMRHRDRALQGRLCGSTFGICRGLAEVCNHRKWLPSVMQVVSHTVLQLHKNNAGEGEAERGG